MANLKELKHTTRGKCKRKNKKNRIRGEDKFKGYSENHMDGEDDSSSSMGFDVMGSTEKPENNNYEKDSKKMRSKKSRNLRDLKKVANDPNWEEKYRGMSYSPENGLEEFEKSQESIHIDVNTENYFDAAQALYWICSDWHDGQSSVMYSILSTLGYGPGMDESGPESGTEAEMIYDELNELCEKDYPAAERVCAKLKKDIEHVHEQAKRTEASFKGIVKSAKKGKKRRCWDGYKPVSGKNPYS